MNHVTSYSTSEGDVTWVGAKSMFIYGYHPVKVEGVNEGYLDVDEDEDQTFLPILKNFTQVRPSLKTAR